MTTGAILFFSDLHAHNFPDCAVPVSEGINSRLLDCLNIIDQIGAYAKKYDVKDIVFGGDLFHVPGRIEVPVFNAVINALVKLCIETEAGLWLIVGNHDQYNRSGTIHSLEALKLKEGLFYIIDEPAFCEVGGREIALIPYSPLRDTVTKNIKHLRKRTSVEIAVLHQGLSGVPVGKSGYTIDENLAPSDLPTTTKLNLLGHYHEHRQVTGNSFFIGSPLQHNWGDEGQNKWCVLVEADDTVEMLPLSAPKFVTVPLQGSVEACLKDSDVMEKYARGNFIRVQSSLALTAQDIGKVKAEIEKAGARFVKYEQHTGGEDMPVTEGIPTGAIIDTQSAIRAYVEAAAPEKCGLDKQHVIETGAGFMRTQAQQL